MQRRFLHFRAGWVGMLMMLLPQPAVAAWPTDPLTNVPLCTAAGNQYFPTIVGDGAGGAIVTWHDNRNGTDSDIYVEHVLSSGAPDPAWPINGRALCKAAGDQQYPTIVAAGTGGAIVAWHDARSGTNVDIYVQHVLASGAVDPAWPPDGRALCTASGNQQYPTIVGDGAGNAIVAWYDNRSGNYDIYAQRVLASGAVDPAWPTNGRALCTAANDQSSPIVADGAGGALLAWYDYRSGTNYDIYAQHVLVTGVADPSWPTDGRGLCTAGRDQYAPTIVGDGSGGAIVTWYDARNGSDYDIYAQHVMASGAVDPAWPVDGRALCTATGDQQYPKLVADGAGGAIVTWEDIRSGMVSDIFAQRVLASGAVDPAWPVNGRALCIAADNQYRPSIVADGAGGAIIAWFDIRNGTDHDIYAQRVLASGAVDPAWPTDGRAVCTAAESQAAPSVIRDGAGGAILAWHDFRNGANYDIYAQRVQMNGQLGGGPLGVPGEGSLATVLDPVRPNPSRGGVLEVRFALGTAGAAWLELLDVAGRRIRAREVGSLGVGRHVLDLGEGQRQAPGIYLVRLRQGDDMRVTRVAVLD